MSLLYFRKLGLGEPKTTFSILQMENGAIKKLFGIMEMCLSRWRNLYPIRFYYSRYEEEQ